MATYSIADLSHREDVRDTGRSERGLTSFAIAQTAEHRTPEQILGRYFR